jgi:undecaprenyl-diphosphatase
VALAVFLWFILRRDYKLIAVITLIWAALVAYSRVYLGVHYLGDVLMGTLMGSLYGVLVYYGYAFAKARFAQKTKD